MTSEGAQQVSHAIGTESGPPASKDVADHVGAKPPGLADDELMAETRRGSQAAFEALFDRYREPVWRFFRRRTPDAGIAEELAQDTFVALLEGARRYTGKGMFRSYLFGVAYNVLLADRRRRTQRSAERLTADPAAPPSDPDDVIWLREALAALDESDREILMLRQYEELSYQEIAEVCGVPLNTVRSQLFRARMALKSALEARAPQPVRSSHVGH
jgi:RNA polymerase sigma-70 factor (ECF subfamily)